jgi:hypothetical protein
MEGYENRVSCRNVFKKLQILPLISQYQQSWVMFVVQNLFLTNIENHNIDTRQKNSLYLPQASLRKLNHLSKRGLLLRDKNL